MEFIKEFLYSNEFRERNRVLKKDFTRKRKMDLPEMVLFLLNNVRQTLQKELTNFMELFSSKSKNITKSAFCQSRMKLRPEAFVELSDALLNEFYTDNNELLWKDFRLLAVDGSFLQVPFSNEIKEEFGCRGNHLGETLPMAIISTCYDVLNEMVLDSQIANCRTSEYDLALRHLKKSSENDLFIYDRGYSAVWLMYKHIVDKRDFVIRIQRNSMKEINFFFGSDEKDKVIEINELPRASKKRIIDLGIKFKPFKIRLTKVILASGEIEILATSLLDKEKYPLSDFEDLYWKRWSVETNYGHLKNNLLLEDFTGFSSMSIKQDFFASMFIINLQGVIINDIRSDLEKKKSKKDYRYKVNRKLSLGFMKNRVIEIFFNRGKDSYCELKKLFQIEPVPIRLGRKNSRKKQNNRRRFHMNQKRAI